MGNDGDMIPVFFSFVFVHPCVVCFLFNDFQHFLVSLLVRFVINTFPLEIRSFP